MGKSVAAVSSTVICVVVAAVTLPPLRTPERTGSAISITAPGLTTTPESIEVANATISLSFCSANKIAFANLLACPLYVQANPFTCLIITPNFAIEAVSS